MTWAWVALVVVVVGFFVLRMRPAKGVMSVTAADMKQLMNDKRQTAGMQFIDVREPSEYRSGHAQGFKNIPLGQLKNHLGELNRDQPVVVMCHSGARSTQAARMLAKQGFKDVRNVRGGMMAWGSRR